ERGTGSIFGDGLNNRSDFFATMVQAESYINQGEIGQGFSIALNALQLGEGLKSARCVQYVREFQGRVTEGMRRATDFREFEEKARGFRLWRQAG
ncbi:hypothetical protein AB4Z54_46295, partial [Streptomyces sp. MCAF7]